jgi:hypothetical protein
MVSIERFYVFDFLLLLIIEIKYLIRAVVVVHLNGIDCAFLSLIGQFFFISFKKSNTLIVNHFLLFQMLLNF